MADQDKGATVTREVLQQIIQDLTDENPFNTERAIIRASHYPALYERLMENWHTVDKIRRGEISLELKETLLQQFFGLGEEQLAEFSLEPNRPIHDAEIAKRAQLHSEAHAYIDEAIKNRTGERERLIYEFSEKLATNFSLGSFDSFMRQMNNVPQDATSGTLRDQAHEALVDTLKNSGRTADPAEIREALREYAPYFDELAFNGNGLAFLHTGAHQLLYAQAGNIGNTRLLAEMVTTKIDQGVTGPLPAAVYQVRAQEAMQLPADAVRSLIGNEEPSGIFQKAGLAQTAKILKGQPIAKQRAMIVGFMIQQAEDAVDKKMLQLGDLSADQIKAYLRRTGDTILGSEGATSGISDKFSSVFSSFSHEIKGADEIMTLYMQSVYNRILSPEEVKALGFDRFLVSAVNVSTDSFYPTVDSTGHTNLNWLPDLISLKRRPPGGSAVIITGAGGAIGFGRIGGFFAGWATLTGIRGVIGRVGVSALRFFSIVAKFFAKFLAFIPGWVFLPLTFVLPAIGRGISNLAGKAINGELGVAGYSTPGILSAFGGARPTKSDTKATLLVGCGGCLFVFVIPFLVVFLVVGSQMGREGEGFGGGDYVGSSYAGNLPPEGQVGEITWCPIDHGSISGYTPNRGKTHINRDAYDLGAYTGQEVRAAHDGTVYAYGCDGVYVFCNHKPPGNWVGYGNFVVLAGRHADGSIFFTHYAHLLSWDPIVETGTVKAGDVIGRADNKGNSTGTHLHWEYRNRAGYCPCDIVPFLPSGEHACNIR